MTPAPAPQDDLAAFLTAASALKPKHLRRLDRQRLRAETIRALRRNRRGAR